jgi:hypothetical protein
MPWPNDGAAIPMTVAHRASDIRLIVMSGEYKVGGHEGEVAMKPYLLALTVVGFVWSTQVSGQGGNPQYGKPKRLNKMIELLAAGQPVYDSNVTGGGYEEGKKLAQTDQRSDSVRDGARAVRTAAPARIHAGARGRRAHQERPPDADRHRHAAVSRAGCRVVRANTWVVEQILTAGVHG